MRYYDGKPPEVLRGGVAWPNAHFELIEQTTEIAPGIHLIALVSDRPGTLELRELSLAIETPEGMVILVGCSHPGIENIVTAIETSPCHCQNPHPPPLPARAPPRAAARAFDLFQLA